MTNRAVALARHSSILFALASGALACGDEPTGSATGTLTIVTTTGGLDIDPDGYTLLVTGFPPRQVQSNGTTQVYRAAPGSYNVALSGLAANCSLTSGGGPATVSANGTLDLTLAVDCTALPGIVRVGVKTRGQDPDMGGYQILLDGVFLARAPDSGSVILNDVPAGTHTLALDEVASNCTSFGPQSVDIEVSHDEVAAADFLFLCQHTPKIATTSALTGFVLLYTMNEDGTGAFALTGDTLYARSPAWSPDGARIAFADLFDAVWLVDPDGGRLRPLGIVGAHAFDPAWSPNGTRLAVAYWIDDITESAIYTSDRNGGHLKPLTSGAFDTHPAWSPDGSRIAFQREYPNSERRLFIVNSDGSGEVQLTTAIDDREPAWSPDGSLILFTGQGPFGERRLYLVQPDGNGRESLQSLAVPAWGHTPVWAHAGTQIITTDGLRLYAVDLATRQELWSVDTPQNIDGLSWRP